MFRTFRGRLAMMFVAIEFGILMLAAILLYGALTHRVNQDVDDQLMQEAQWIGNRLEHAPFYAWSSEMSAFAQRFSGPAELVSINGVLLFSAGQTLIGHGGNKVSQVLKRAFGRESVAFVSTKSLLQKSNYRIIARPIRLGGEVVAVVLLGKSTSDISAIFRLLFIIGGLLGLLMMSLSAAAGYFMAKKALDPIQEITSTARAVAAGDLSRRLESKSQDKELRILVNVLNKMFADLEASFRAQRRFTADASHELRLPLTILKGEIEVALRHPRSREEYEHILRQQLETVERMQRIVNDLLTLARADAGQLDLVQEPVDLSLLLREVGQQHLILFASQHITLDMDITDGMEVIGDGAHLERVFMNLLNNAYKYAPEHSTVRLRAQVADEQWASVSISDEGPGIPPEKQPLLFDRFYRADDARCRKQGDGAGLGLSICKRIVDAHGGHIEVHSEPGHGATFIVRLPLAGPDPSHSQRLHRVLDARWDPYA
ncbi:MAG: sensor histidine kinase [Zetaproteobacteria bacterium]|nr:MAG: sensor histidine kinase [Zetaproteobacteria bacterium]